MRLRVQQTQKSFSMIVLAIPRMAALSPKSAARSAEGRRATLSTKVAQSVTGNRQKSSAHPSRRLSCALAEDLLVAVRQGTGRDLRHICSAGHTDMPQRLNDGPGWTAGGDQILRRGMTEIHDALAQHDAPGGAIGEPRALGGNLGRKAKRVCGAGAVDLQMRAGSPGREPVPHRPAQGTEAPVWGAAWESHKAHGQAAATVRTSSIGTGLGRQRPGWRYRGNHAA